MTRILRLKFRRLVIVGALGAGAVALALGTTAASASTTAPAWNYPTPTPTVHYTPPPMPRHHKPPKPEVVCFFSVETEHDAIPAASYGDQGNGYGYAAPSSSATDSYGQPNADKSAESVEVVQLVKVCVTEEHGKPESVTAVDESQPYAWLNAPGGYDPTPSGLPASIGAMLTK
jgi:hypothetical protein